MFQDASANNNKTTVQQDPGPITIINVRPDPSPEVTTAAPSAPKVRSSKQNVPLPPIPGGATPLPTSPQPPLPKAAAPDQTTNTNQYKVDYLGSLSLPGRATSLESLQHPLKELYSLYRANNLNHKSVYRGSMEISPAGLRILYCAEGRRSVPQVLR